MKTLIQKIEYINGKVKNSFSITRYNDKWQFSPYENNNNSKKFQVSGKYYPCESRSFLELIDKVYELLK